MSSTESISCPVPFKRRSTQALITTCSYKPILRRSTNRPPLARISPPPPASRVSHLSEIHAFLLSYMKNHFEFTLEMSQPG